MKCEDQKLSHISIKSAIGALGFIGVIAALCIALQGGVMQMQMRASAEEVFDTKDMVADILPPPMYLVELRLLLSQTAEGTINRRQARENFDRLKKSYEDRVAYWKSRTAGGLGEQLLGRQHETAERFMKQAREQLIDAPADAPLQLLAEQLHSLHPLYEAHRIAVDETVAAGNQVAKKAAEKFVQTQTLSRSLSVGILMLAFLGVAAGARWVNLQLQRPLKACADRARRIAQGDLSEERRNSRPRTDVIGELEFSMEDMRKQLADLVQAVRSNAEGVALSSNQIAMGNHDLAVRTEQQASALQETSSTMSSLSTAVHTSAGNARQANQVSAGACSVAERGGKVVGQVIEMIDGVADSSKRIADIIAVIDGIAFQTNILALNAAVEASRAGEQGRGFAVVAGEVRALAKRSSDAAHEIRKLIALSVEQVAQSTELVQSAGHTMQEIVNSSRQVSGLVSEISVATGEQSEAVAQVSRAAELMDQSTQQNAALVEECAAAAEGLKQQAQQLVEAVAIFKLASRTAAP